MADGSPTLLRICMSKKASRIDCKLLSIYVYNNMEQSILHLFPFYKELLKKKKFMSDSLVNCVLDPLAHPAIFLV